MKPDKNKDITEQMAEMLRKHSLPYKEGAWERFKDFEASRKKSIILWPYISGIAAAILLTFTLFINNREDIEKNVQIAKSQISINNERDIAIQPEKDIQNESSVSSKIEPNRKLIADYDAKVNHQSNYKQGSTFNSLEVTMSGKTTDIASPNVIVAASEPVLSEFEHNESHLLTLQSETQDLAAKTPSKISVPSEIRPQDNDETNKNIFDTMSLAYNGGSETTSSSSDESSDKWNFSIEVSPNIKDNNVNFGGGVGVAYNISKRLSINSGVSYVQLDAHRDPNQIDIPQEFSKTSLNSYNYNKTLNEVNTSLVGLDIPINLKLNINRNVYASAGVSMFSVLNESRNNSFEEHVAVLSYSDAPSGKAPKPVMNTVYSTEKSAVTPYEGKNFTGFLNFSVGYKLPFLQNLNLAVEPYLKLPIGSLSNHDMDLSNGGLKIITNF